MKVQLTEELEVHKDDIKMSPSVSHSHLYESLDPAEVSFEDEGEICFDLCRYDALIQETFHLQSRRTIMVSQLTPKQN